MRVFCVDVWSGTGVVLIGVLIVRGFDVWLVHDPPPPPDPIDQPDPPPPLTTSLSVVNIPSEEYAVPVVLVAYPL